MPYEPRTTTLVCELVHPPRPIDATPIQRLHNHMFTSGRPAYASFSVTPRGPVLGNPTTTPNAVSTVAFHADRILFREELTGVTHEDFAARVRAIVEAVAKPTGVQVIAGQQVVVRMLVNPRHVPDGRAFMKAGVLGLDAETAAFGREPATFGVRLAFPAVEPERAAHDLRIESANADPRSIFLEDRAVFGPTVVERGLAPLEHNVLSTYDFVVERGLAFVGGFDVQVGRDEHR